jgi:murein DD-endopeptidase MepM/ murein hydrolase activator NlpD
LVISTAYSIDHPALDIPGTAGTTPIYAFAAGKISWKQTYNSNWDPSNDDSTHNSSTMNSMGNAVAINHNNRDTTIMSGTYARSIYMHMYSACSLSEGTSVSKGDIIGYIGNTRRSSAAHLHFCLSVGSLTSMAPNQQGWVSISDLPNKNAVNSYLPNYHF